MGEEIKMDSLNKVERKASRSSKSNLPNLFMYWATIVGVLGITDQAAAFKLDTQPEWQVRWDNTVLYNLGIRAQKIQDSIGNNPISSEGDYRFPNRGDVVTNRISNLSEFDAVYQGKYGVRVSASVWRDFAYNDDEVKNNPRLPQALYGSYSSGSYSNYTKRYYWQGGEFLDAFVFTNFELAGQPSSIRVGRLTQYWGNALFYGGLGINYAQNPSDSIKGLTAPGSKAKELAMPRAQLLFQTSLTDTLSMAAQVFGEFRPNRLPEGGTFLNLAGPAFVGPDRFALGPGFFLPRGNDVKPRAGADYGLKLAWAPEWLEGGNIGFYYRELSETQPWLLVTPTLSEYHLAYGKDVTLYGISLDKSIGDFSTGFELSYRKNTALNSVNTALDPTASAGATGNTVQFIANGFYSLKSNALWDTGALLFEIGYQRKLATTSNQAMEVVENSIACPGDVRDGCSTKQSWGASVLFNPQWLSVAPGVNLDMPIFIQYQFKGNTATRSGANKEGNAFYSVGLHALVRARYDLTVAYNGFHARTNGKSTVGMAGSYDSDDLGGNGFGFWNDRGWLSFTFGTTF
jgi:hypothetical protein